MTLPEVGLKPWTVLITKSKDGTYHAEHLTFMQKGLTLDTMYYILIPYLGWHRQIDIHLDVPTEDLSILQERISADLQQVRLTVAYTEPISLHAITYMYNLAHYSEMDQYSFKELKGFAKGKTIVYVGAGPSFAENCHQLEAIRNNIILIAGGTGIKRCREFNIKPDLCLALDPYDTELSILDEDVWDDVPLLAGGILHPKVFKAWKGPVIRQPGGYSTDLWKIFEPDANHIMQGSGVSVWAGYLAAYFGARRMVYFGVDLCQREPFEGSIQVEGKHTTVTWENERLEIGMCADKNPSVSYIQASEGLTCGNIPVRKLEDIGFVEDTKAIPLRQMPKHKDYKEEIKKAAEQCRDMILNFRKGHNNIIREAILHSCQQAVTAARWRTHDDNWGLLQACLYGHATLFEDVLTKEYEGEPDYLKRSYRGGSNFTVILKRGNPLNKV